MICDRCGNKDKKLLFISVFNLDSICVCCKEEEEKHNEYSKAIRVNRAEEAKGNYDFEGIGLPEDLIKIK